MANLVPRSIVLPPWAAVAIELLKQCASPPLRAQAEQFSRLAATATDHLGILRRRNLDSLYYLLCDPGSPAQAVYDKTWTAQRKQLLHVVAALADAGIGAIILKGAEFISRYYHPHALSFLNDVDLLVAEHQLGATSQVLFELGFRQAQFDENSGRLLDRDVFDVAAEEAGHYELAPFCLLDEIELTPAEREFTGVARRLPLVLWNERALVNVEIDVHREIAADTRDDFSSRLVPSAVGTGLTLCPADHLWATTSRYYREVGAHGKKTLRDLAYLAPLIGQPDLDWDHVLRANLKHALGPSLFYYLSFLDRLAGGVIPAEVLNILRRTGQPWALDWGWQLGKLFDSIDPFPDYLGL